MRKLALERDPTCAVVTTSAGEGPARVAWDT